MLHTFGIIGGILGIVAAIPYIWDTVQGSTRPNQVTWFIWVVLLSIALASQIASGGKDSLLFIIGDLIASGTILILALFKGEKKWHWIDKWALVGAGGGLLLWYLFNQPFLALIMTLFVDFTGAIPTLRKSFMDPKSETLIGWIITASGAIFSMLAVGTFNLTFLVYPLYLMLINLGVALAIILGRVRLKKMGLS